MGKYLTASPKSAGLLCLVQHVDKITVFKDILNLTGGQQVFHILRQAARYAALP